MSDQKQVLTWAALILSCLSLPAQEPKPEPKQTESKITATGIVRLCDEKGEPAGLCVRVLTMRPQATMWSTLSGNIYAWVFTDPNNEYRCFVSSTLPGRVTTNSFTVTCVKLAELEPNRTVVTDGK